MWRTYVPGRIIPRSAPISMLIEWHDSCLWNSKNMFPNGYNLCLRTGGDEDETTFVVAHHNQLDLLLAEFGSTLHNLRMFWSLLRL